MLHSRMTPRTTHKINMQMKLFLIGILGGKRNIAHLQKGMSLTQMGAGQAPC